MENIALWLMQYASFPLEIIKTFGLDLSNDTFKDKELSKSGKIWKAFKLSTSLSSTSTVHQIDHHL